MLVASARRDAARLEIDDSTEAGSREGAWTHRVGAVYLLDGGFAPYVSQSRSFELITGTDAFGAAFKPKRGEQVEAGLKWSPRDSVIVSAAGYHLIENNRLTADPENPNNQVQRGEVTVDGVELEASATLAAWDFVSAYTWSDATVSASSDPLDPYQGKRLTSIPDHAASLWAVRKFALQGTAVRTGAGVRFVGRTWDGQDQHSVPSNTLVDALFSIDARPVALRAERQQPPRQDLPRDLPRPRRLLVRHPPQGRRHAQPGLVGRARPTRIVRGDTTPISPSIRRV